MPGKSRTAGGWQAGTLARIRALIREADPGVVEEVKWRKPSNAMQGVPVWSHDGMLCTGETYKDKVKLTFARGASLEDPAGLFNSSLDAGTRRAIDIHEGGAVDAGAFKALVKAAVAANAVPVASRGRRRPAPERPVRKPSPGTPVRKPAAGKPVRKPSAGTPVRKPAAGKPVLLSGGNPQIAKADGDAPVQAYIAAVPGWKRDIVRRLDALVVQAVPGVRKAVKWNSPFYGIEGQGWFASLHVFTNYVKVTFFRGTSLRPVPPGGTGKDARWIDVHGDDLDEGRMATWLKQAAALPGWAT